MKRFEQARKNFLTVRDTLLHESEGEPYGVAARAYRLAWSIPLIVYLDRTPDEAIQALKGKVANL